MKEKEFIFELVVYLKDTNLFGNAYFASYFDWQGKAREEFFRKIIGGEKSFLTTGIKLVTIEASMQYKKEVTLFDEVQVRLRVDNIKVATFELFFTYINKKTSDIIATGKQKIGFADSSYNVIPIPEEMKIGWAKLQQSDLE